MQQLVLDLGLARVPSLDDFRVGDNQAALVHLREWAQRGLVFRSAVPTYLWGSSGVGKSHVLRAVQDELQQRGVAVGFCDASTRDAEDFDERWGAVVMDDVDQYDAPQQHSAFKWFVNAQTARCPVLAAGAGPASALALRADLRTRLASGLAFELRPLDEAGCREVLQTSARARGLVLGDGVLDFVFARFSRDLASLVQLLDRLDQFALSAQRSITIPLVRSMLESE